MQNKKEEGELINLTERVSIVYTDKAPEYVKGRQSQVHPKVAAKLKAKGWIK